MPLLRYKFGINALLVFALATSMAAAQEIPIENDQVRVVLAANTPGQKSGRHRHTVNRVMVHLDAGVMRLAYEGLPVQDVKFAPGEVRWDPAGGFHTSENVGGTHYHIVEIELKQPGRKSFAYPASDAIRKAPGVYSVELENDQVRVIRARLAPGASSPMHDHPFPSVRVFLSGGLVEAKLPDGSTREVKVRPGEVRWAEVMSHATRNPGKETFEALLIEVK